MIERQDKRDSSEIQASPGATLGSSTCSQEMRGDPTASSDSKTPRFHIKADDLFPDAVSLGLVATPTKASEVLIAISLALASQWVDIHTRDYGFLRRRWRFRFSIRAGDLILDLDNLLSPRSKRNFQRRLPTESSVKHTHHREEAQSRSKSGIVSIGLPRHKGGIVPSASGERKTSSESEDRTSQADEYEEQQVAILAKGSESQPKWQFESKTPDPLAGHLDDWLARLDPTDSTFGLNGRFQVSINSVVINEVDGDKYTDLSMKKQRMIELRMRKYVHDYSRDHISRVTMRYGI